MKKILPVVLTFIFSGLVAQKVTLNPTITPALFSYNDQITIKYDVTGTALANLSNAWVWVWIPGKNVDAKYNINPATAAADPAKFTKSTDAGNTYWAISFKPSDFFNTDISGESQMGVLLKASDWPGGQTTDYIANFGFRITLVSPTVFPVSVAVTGSINIEATAPVAANFSLYVNDNLVDSDPGVLSYTYSYVVPASPGDAIVRVSATSVSGGETSENLFQYVVTTNSPEQARPPGIIAGINYDVDPTKVTLCLWAPGKSAVYAFGDFSDWNVLTENLMSRDGDYFWIELSGLTPGMEYGFQYWVDGSLKIAEPFADKILDPEDQYIPDESYPNLKAYPEEALTSTWYFNRVAVFQTNQEPYQWQNPEFEKPKKESLVIYELLIRDFFDFGNRNYQNLIDTISYLKRLGVNAIELMPVMEFNGNEGWGYNPTFMFAPDKYYGSKNKLKEFIDVCHGNGIAVIFDIAMNHQDVPNPFVLMDFDFVNFKPNPTNKWFNVTATHPFSVFFDMNHESQYTKAYLDTVNNYWINEYKIDGYRFDLSKGFTQKITGSDVGAWSAYDASRITLLKRMADKVWSYSPDAYVILEHLGVDSEEKELADYRANEGKGMMLWGKMTDQYNQNTMGFASSSDISRVDAGTRNFNVPNLVGYMESHDEERLMYKNIAFGNSNSNYSAKDVNTALKRMEAASALFYTIPGPKMLWQFGELGFDYSINRCEDGTVNPPGSEGGNGDCRLSIKPPVWEYQEDVFRGNLFERTANLVTLKKNYNVFQSGTATFSADNLVKQVTIRNKNYTTTPSDSSQMSAVIAVNFDLIIKPVQVGFPHTGTWYDFQTGQAVEVQGATASFNLKPGAYKIFTNVEISNPLVTEIYSDSKEPAVTAFPNPVDDYFETTEDFNSLSLIAVTGARVRPERINRFTWSMQSVNPGLYLGIGEKDGQYYKFKIIKK